MRIPCDEQESGRREGHCSRYARQLRALDGGRGRRSWVSERVRWALPEASTEVVGSGYGYRGKQSPGRLGWE